MLLYVLSHLILTTQTWRYVFVLSVYPHLTHKETEGAMLSNLPKITQTSWSILSPPPKNDGRDRIQSRPSPQAL